MGARDPDEVEGELRTATAAVGADRVARPRRSTLYRVAVRRPVAVAMVFLAVVVFGAFSLRRLPLELMPDIRYPRLTVRTDYPGAAPAEVETHVSRPLEEALGVVKGLTRIESSSRSGRSDVVLELAWDADMDLASRDVLERLDAARAELPPDVAQPLVLRYDPALDPVLTLAVAGDGERFSGDAGAKLLRRIADSEIRRLLEPIEGVAAVRVRGGLEDEIHVELDEHQLRRTGISAKTVADRLAAENVNLAGGTMRDGRSRYVVRTVNEFSSVEELGALVVVRRGGRDVRLRDLAEIGVGARTRTEITRRNESEAIEVEVYKESDANIVEVAAHVREQVVDAIAPRLASHYGAAVSVAVDRSEFVRSSIDEVRAAALFGSLLAVVVLFVFSRDLRSTLIVGIAIPVSLVVTFAPFAAVGVSLNIMSLGGLALGVGMLVDNSIVVLESIARCRDEGDDLPTAAVRGTAEVGAAVTASTFTTVAVFLPMVFVDGVAGQLFGDLGLAVVFSLLASLAVAVFLIPMLAARTGGGETRPGESGVRALAAALRRTLATWNCARELAGAASGLRRRPWLVFLAHTALLRFAFHLAFELVAKLILLVVVAAGIVVVGVTVLARPVLAVVVQPLVAAFSLVLEAMVRGYPGVLRWGLRNRVVVYAGCAVALVATVWGASRLDTELLPRLHHGEFTVELALPVGTPLERTDEIVRPIERRILNDTPGIAALATSIGSGRGDGERGEYGEHTARLQIELDDAVSWSAADGAVEAEHTAMAAVRQALVGVPDLRVNITRPSLLSFAPPVAVEVRGQDLDELQRATQAVAAGLRAVDGLFDVETTMQAGGPEVHIVYDRDRLARAGLDLRTVASHVRDLVQGSEATRLRHGERDIPVRLRLAGAGTATVAALHELVVNPGGDRPIPLSAVADIVVDRGPSEVRRVGQQRVGIVTANTDGVGLGELTARVAAAVGELDLPPGVSTEVVGQHHDWDAASQSLALAFAVSVFLVYAIMAVQFESLIYPLVILFTIPLALLGVVVALLVLDMPISVMVFLGAVLLAGIVVNNAIMLVDYAGQLEARGHSTEDALVIAGRVRLRPILMTTATTVLGLLPMAFGVGSGAELRAPIAITVIAGLSLSTVLTLVVIPTLYATADRVFGHRRGDDAARRLWADLAAIRPDQLRPEGDELPLR